MNFFRERQPCRRKGGRQCPSSCQEPTVPYVALLCKRKLLHKPVQHSTNNHRNFMSLLCATIIPGVGLPAWNPTSVLGWGCSAVGGGRVW